MYREHHEEVPRERLLAGPTRERLRAGPGLDELHHVLQLGGHLHHAAAEQRLSRGHVYLFGVLLTLSHSCPPHTITGTPPPPPGPHPQTSMLLCLAASACGVSSENNWLRLVLFISGERSVQSAVRHRLAPAHRPRLTCPVQIAQEVAKNARKLEFVGLGLSLVCLIVSIFIFTYFR